MPRTSDFTSGLLRTLWSEVQSSVHPAQCRIRRRCSEGSGELSWIKLKTQSCASLVAQTGEHLPAMQETWIWSLGREDPLEKRRATHSSILAWRIPWTEEPGGLQSMGSQRVGRDWACTQNTKLKHVGNCTRAEKAFVYASTPAETSLTWAKARRLWKQNR